MHASLHPCMHIHESKSICLYTLDESTYACMHTCHPHKYNNNNNN